MDKGHKEILLLIQKNARRSTRHTYSDRYLGNDHYRYPISMPVLRRIAREWMIRRDHLQSEDIAHILTSLIEAESSTEKCMAGILLDYTTSDQRKFDVRRFDRWLDHLVGWAEVDSVCTGKYTITELPENWAAWKKLLTSFSRSANINKRRASLVMLCSSLRNSKNDRMAKFALQQVDRLKGEKVGLITKAISWVLRSMAKHHREILASYIRKSRNGLPAIAVRETLTKLKTGKKTRL
jgi:3-methyladenine DNA glycosylase AlkD